MSAYALSLIRKGQTYNEFYALLRGILPSSEYPQSPQLEGSDANKNRPVFAENTEPLPPVEPEQETGIMDWLEKYWWAILLVVIAGIILWRIF
jgi:hypothetical protein